MFTEVVFSQRYLPTSVFEPVMALPYHLFILATNVPGSSTTHPRDKEPQVGRRPADVHQRLGLGRTDDEADVIPGVPLLGEAGDMDV